MFSKYFKAMSALNFVADKDIEFDELAELVPKLVHKDIRPEQRETIGFSSVIGYHNPDLLLYKVDRFILLSVTYEFKKVSKNKIERQLAERKKAIAEANKIEIEDISEQEIEDITEKLTKEELRRVSSTEDRCNLIIDPLRNRIYLSAISTTVICKKAISLLQKCVPDMQVHPFAPLTVETILTQWVYKPKNALPEEMELGQQVALKSENDSRAKLYKQDLFSSEISTLIDHGKQVHELGLQFNERVEFVMTHQCHLKKVKPTDLFYDGLDEHIEGVSYLENYEPHWFLLCAFLVEIFDWMHSEFEIPTPNDSQKAQE